ncbi:Hypothetical predicted protein [Podarcis lilfordi]|uniref:Transmembrane protein 95 n=1 Tax=Podarcis lilfordi TaxID=74358 RepID=A0AA35L8Z7_9SAUR|nr:Hypothetical predicted protein [Podarcis lilfordi]
MALPKSFFAPRALGPASRSPATLALLLLLLACESPETEGCIHCGLHSKNLKTRFAYLCAQYRERYRQANCTGYPWGRESSLGLALDDMSLDLLLEKTHRVFRVIEINQSLTDFPKFWNWLHEVKIPEQSREALCPPACQGSALVWNCTTCRRVELRCWDMKTCYPEGGGLEKITRLICSISGSCLFLGIVSCALEFWLRANTREEEGPV